MLCRCDLVRIEINILIVLVTCNYCRVMMLVLQDFTTESIQERTYTTTLLMSLETWRPIIVSAVQLLMSRGLMST